jgi:O-antigen ligase
MPFSQYPPSQREIPIWNLVLGWTAFLPLLYLAMGANLVPTQGVAFRMAATEDAGLAHKVPLALVLLVCGTLIFRRWAEVFALCQRMKAIVAVPLFAILSMLWSGMRGHTFLSGCILLVLTCYAIYIGGIFSYTRQLELILFTGAFALVLGALFVVLMPDVGGDRYQGWRGILGHKQNAGAVMTFLFITAIHWKPPTAIYRLLRAAYAAMCLLFIVMSQSRTGWGLCLVAVTLTLGFRLIQRFAAKEAMLTLFVATVSIVALAYASIEYLPDFLYAIGRDPTLDERTVIWAAALKSIAAHPFLGYGYAAFWQGASGPSLDMVLAAGWVLTQAQNGYLDLCLQIGVCGLSLLALIVVGGFRNMFRCFRQTSEQTYVRWCAVVLICALLYDIGESSMFIQRFSWFLFLVACVGLARVARSSRQVAVAHPAERDITVEPAALETAAAGT